MSHPLSVTKRMFYRVAALQDIPDDVARLHWQTKVEPQIKQAGGAENAQLRELVSDAVEAWAADNSGEPERLPGPRLRAMLEGDV